MKKMFFTIVFVIAFMTFTFAFASTDYEENVQYKINNLPASLLEVEDEAFEGTAITNIVFPETLTTIGNRSFANNPNLRSVQIPMTTTSIANTAFDGSNHVSITAAPNSYARTWAKENRIPFSPITVMYAGTGGQNAIGSLPSVLKEVNDAESLETQNTNRTWRKLDEIQVNDTIEIIANVIQGRAPPIA